MNLPCAAATLAADTAGISAADGGARWVATGAQTFDNVAPLYQQSQSLPLPASGVVDCAEIAAVDSSAVALLLAIHRRAVASGVPLRFAHVPAPLASLAQLYGVEDFIDS